MKNRNRSRGRKRRKAHGPEHAGCIAEAGAGVIGIGARTRSVTGALTGVGNQKGTNQDQEVK